LKIYYSLATISYKTEKLRNFVAETGKLIDSIEFLENEYLFDEDRSSMTSVTLRDGKHYKIIFLFRGSCDTKKQIDSAKKHINYEKDNDYDGQQNDDPN
jgi:hypothetical protein